MLKQHAETPFKVASTTSRSVEGDFATILKEKYQKRNFLRYCFSFFSIFLGNQLIGGGGYCFSSFHFSSFRRFIPFNNALVSPIYLIFLKGSIDL